MEPQEERPALLQGAVETAQLFGARATTGAAKRPRYLEFRISVIKQEPEAPAQGCGPMNWRRNDVPR